MTELYLLRHAHAGDPMKWRGDDDERPLSGKGQRQAERLGRMLAEVGFRPDVIVSSPRVRARQTADVVGRLLHTDVAVDMRLAQEIELGQLDDLLGELDADRPLLVGHDPDFSTIVASLCAAGAFPMKKGALARIDVTRPLRPGGGLLRWLVPPDLLRADSDA